MKHVFLCAGIVVLYNPPKKVIENIKTYFNHLNFLYIFDNSNKPQDFILDLVKKNRKIRYINCRHNKGVGYAYNYVSNIAIEEGYDWLLIMDQDSYFRNDDLKKIINVLEKDNGYFKKSVGILCPVIVYENENIDLLKRDEFEKILIGINSGSILNLDAYKKAGNFREDYFLDRTDFEYFLRLNKFGYHTLRYKGAFLYHKLGNLEIKNIFGFKIRVTHHNPLRHYYMTRNAIDIVKNYFFIFPGHCFYEIRSIFTDMIKVLLFEKNKLAKIKMILKAIFNSLLI
jgi:rhamnosyltransferase